MSIYQTKESKEASFKKKRYPDVPMPRKNAKSTNFIEYSIEDKDFIEEGQKQPVKKAEYAGGLPK